MKDWAGTVMGRWTVVKFVGMSAGRTKSRSLWRCRCSCGTERVVKSNSFGKRFTSCGCQKRERLKGKPSPHRKNVAGQRFGRLVAIEPISDGKRVKWKCKCDCGQELFVATCNLLHGQESCGCLGLERSAAACRTHGMSKGVPEYAIWAAMRRRCDYKKDRHYRDYGGRGIRVCRRWMRFENFWKDMGPRPTRKHSLDRYPDKNGHYKPSNCRWATPSQQQRNTRANKLVMFRGATKTLIEWCEERKMPYFTIASRLNHGWSAEDAFTRPLRKTRVTGTWVPA